MESFQQLIRANTEDSLVYGVKYRKQEFVGWAADNNRMFGTRICEVAAYHGRLDLLESAIKNGIALTEQAYYEAARGGHLNVVQRLLGKAYEDDYPKITAVILGAAEGGHLEILRWGGKRWRSGAAVKNLQSTYGENQKLSVRAALNGHLRVLEWLCSVSMFHEFGADWRIKCGEETCAAAAIGGHLHIVKWLRTTANIAYHPHKICPWDGHTILNALLNGHDHVAVWAARNGCPWDPLTFPPSMTTRLNVLLTMA